MKTAIIIGSSGMVGTQLLDLLLISNEYSQIISLVRRRSGIQHSKLNEHIVNFYKPESYKNLVKGDVLYSCMGTTLAQAKSKNNQYRVDFTYQYQVAETAAQNNVPVYVLVSSAGANAKSGAFYMQMKGKLDEAVSKLNFSSIQIIRPGQLYGLRTEKRIAEKLAIKIMFFLNKLGILNKYKPIHAREIAQAMIVAARNNSLHTYTLDEVFGLIK
jgi:uncharacterized protein YbjT (DUF2867 family)